MEEGAVFCNTNKYYRNVSAKKYNPYCFGVLFFSIK